MENEWLYTKISEHVAVYSCGRYVIHYDKYRLREGEGACYQLFENGDFIIGADNSKSLKNKTEMLQLIEVLKGHH